MCYHIELVCIKVCLCTIYVCVRRRVFACVCACAHACVCSGACVGVPPVVDTVPGSVVFVRDLFDSPRVVCGILPQQLIGQLVKGGHGGLASAEVLEEHLQAQRNNHDTPPPGLNTMLCVYYDILCHSKRPGISASGNISLHPDLMS